MKEKKDIIPPNEDMDINADADVPGNMHLSNQGAEDVVEKMQGELEEQKDKYLRLVAEFDNYKRRTAKERNELVKTAGKDVIASLLDIMDDCDRAEKQLQESGNTSSN